MTVEEFFNSLSIKWQTIILLIILIVSGFGIIVFDAFKDNNNAYYSWAKIHHVPPCTISDQNCNDEILNVKHNATITFVRDYQVECDTWFSKSTCTKENLSFMTDNNLNQSMTLSCQFYRINDRIIVTETFAWHDFQTPTDNWSIVGVPC